jgi:hypothetical protein
MIGLKAGLAADDPDRGVRALSREQRAHAADSAGVRTVWANHPISMMSDHAAPV